MKTGLIGYTGFVGGNIANQVKFNNYYNSKNLQEIEGKEFDLLVLAAPSASMWVANQNPEKDLENIDRMFSTICKSKTKRIAYLSTVAVYDNPYEVDENTMIDSSSLSAYGKNRLDLEKRILDKYPESLIIRLPGLFGPGLKKNFIFDMLNYQSSEWTNEKSKYQFYNLENIWKDIRIALDSNIHLINITSEPITVIELARECFGIDFVNKSDIKVFDYKVKSIYAAIYGGKNGYMYSRDQTIKDIRSFIKKVQNEVSSI